MKKYRVILVIALLIVSCVFTSPASAFFKHYKGKVIDADTKEPIEGAVVVAIWTREVKHFNVTRDIFKKARETLTDKNGEFSIKSYHHFSLRPLSKLRLKWVIFKPGYASFPQAIPTHWHPRVKPQRNLDKIFRPYTVVKLPTLKTKEERRKYLIGPPGHPVPYKETPLLIEAINVERVTLGFQPGYETIYRTRKERKEKKRKEKQEVKEYKKKERRLRRDRRHIMVTIISPQDGTIVDTDFLDVVVNFGPKKKRKVTIWSLILKLNGEQPIVSKYQKTLVHRYSKPVTEGTHTFKLDIRDLPPGKHTLQACSYPRLMAGSYLETPSLVVTFIKEDIKR